jgi:hypothetical protein
LGACDIAPMASIDERYFGPLEAADAATAIEQLVAGGEVLPEKALEKRPLAGDAPAVSRSQHSGVQGPPSAATSQGGDDA